MFHHVQVNPCSADRSSSSQAKSCREDAKGLSVGCAHNPIAKAQRREGAKKSNAFLCAFASLRLRDIDASRSIVTSRKVCRQNQIPVNIFEEILELRKPLRDLRFFAPSR